MPKSRLRRAINHLTPMATALQHPYPVSAGEGVITYMTVSAQYFRRQATLAEVWLIAAICLALAFAGGIAFRAVMDSTDNGVNPVASQVSEPVGGPEVIRAGVPRLQRAPAGFVQIGSDFRPVRGSAP